MGWRRFITLDAIRGVAALAVFTTHARSIIAPIIIQHAHLAVDLFFLLSGFVIDHAYGRKIAHDLTPGRFIVARYIRLYPLYLISLLIGAAGAAIAFISGHGYFDGPSLAIAIFTGALMLPSPTVSHVETLVPLNYPAWSLIFELAINIIFAGTFRWLTLRVLMAVIGSCAILLCLIGYSYGSIDYGVAWGLEWIGGVRVAFSFFLGVVLRRIYSGSYITTRWAYVVPLIVLPFMMGVGGTLGDLTTIIIVFPIIIVIAASVEPPNIRIMVALGTLSYPLYVIHVPTIQFIARVLIVAGIDQASVRPMAGIGVAAVLSLVALGLDRWWDRSVRRWLTERQLKGGFKFGLSRAIRGDAG